MKEVLKIAALIQLVIFALFGVMWLIDEPPQQTTHENVVESTTTIETETTTQVEPDVNVVSAKAVQSYYAISDAERDLIERVVMAEAGAEPFEGQQAVAQCILNACELTGLRPAQVIKKYQYTKARPHPTADVQRAVETIFDEGVKVLDSGAIYFYAPSMTHSAWHESQVHVATIGGHRFFKEANA